MKLHYVPLFLCCCFGVLFSENVIGEVQPVLVYDQKGSLGKEELSVKSITSKQTNIIAQIYSNGSLFDKISINIIDNVLIDYSKNTGIDINKLIRRQGDNDRHVKLAAAIEELYSNEEVIALANFMRSKEGQSILKKQNALAGVLSEIYFEEFKVLKDSLDNLIEKEQALPVEVFKINFNGYLEIADSILGESFQKMTMNGMESVMYMSSASIDKVVEALEPMILTKGLKDMAGSEEMKKGFSQGLEMYKKMGMEFKEKKMYMNDSGDSFSIMSMSVANKTESAETNMDMIIVQYMDIEEMTSGMKDHMPTAK
tara:strand:- start:220 stop:1158 length:939 start_codon:yes stop_codon:yes gene_type:complete